MLGVSIIGSTGIFQWLALAAYRAVRANAWRLVVILVAATCSDRYSHVDGRRLCHLPSRL